jgi:hypothetical protein
MSDQQYEANWEGLAEELSTSFAIAGQAPAAPRCIVTVTNATPPEWQVLIVAAGTRFNYQDGAGNPEGNPSTDVRSPISIPAGGSVQMASDPNRCVRTTTTVFYLKTPGEEPSPLGASEDAGAASCLTHVPYAIGPRRTVASASLAARDLGQLLQVSPAGQ